MTTTIPTTAPRAFVIGSTVQWREDHGDYLPAEWAGSLEIVSHADQQQFDATDNGDGTHLVTITAAQSAAFTAGAYRYQFNVRDIATSTIRHTLSQGVIEALPDFAQVTGGHDGRSSAAVIFDELDAIMKNKASKDASSLAIGGRSLSRYTMDEISAARGYYATQMTDDERIARGYAPYGERTVRFIR